MPAIRPGRVVEGCAAQELLQPSCSLLHLSPCREGSTWCPCRSCQECTERNRKALTQSSEERGAGHGLPTELHGSSAALCSQPVLAGSRELQMCTAAGRASQQPFLSLSGFCSWPVLQQRRLHTRTAVSIVADGQLKKWVTARTAH